MKGFLAALAAVFTLLSFTACTQQAEPESSGIQEEPQTTPGPIRQLNNQSQNGVYHMEQLRDKNLFCFIDYASNAETPLCSVPDCRHNSEECTAWAGYSGDGREVINELLCLNENTLLYECYSWKEMEETEENAGNWIEVWRMDPDGTDRRLLFKVQNAMSMEYPLYTDGINIYFITSSEEAEGPDTFPSQTEQLVRIDPESGRRKVLWDLGTDIFLGFDEQGRLLSWEIVRDEKSNQYIQTLYVTDLEKSQKTELFKIENKSEHWNKKLTKLGNSIYWFGETVTELYWVDSDGNAGQVNIQMPQQNGEGDLDYIELIDQIDGKLRVRTYDLQENSAQDFLVNKQTGEVQPLTLQMMEGDCLYPIQVHTDTPNGLLVTFESWTNARPGEVDKRMAFLSKEDFAASNNNFKEIDRTAVG